MSKFSIEPKKPEKQEIPTLPTPAVNQQLNSFVEGKNEPMTTMTFMLPARLKFKLKQKALMENMKIREILINNIEQMPV